MSATAAPTVTVAAVEDLLLTSALAPTQVEVKDVSGGCGTSFKLNVVSTAFEGQRLLARQRLVYDALATVMPSIHAVIMTCKTPAQVAAAAAAAPAAPAPAPTPSV
ncbi:hypothetical protein BU14_0057s0001 [Porphyra umbilicalis]|uniref:BolA-like protein n=1 Tax=Porphyra umbilicalis TaxID=2786 RepID=A0A1X6PH85_PORUM|nr:hypothetical protein BU14_0057s0001 [Porphyra umbilicalis]|eukprot:OSX80180.1 hypothetical protein BU14_0057s0001 [Porphyra umbilicalis]